MHPKDMLICVRPLSLPAFIVLYAVPLAAQSVPGRELFHFPLGTMDYSPTLAGGLGDGLANPATIRLAPAERARLAAAALHTPVEQGVRTQLVAGALAFSESVTFGLSAAHVFVSDLFRTESDPRTIGGAIAYNSTLVSAAVAHRYTRWLTGGLAVRYRTGALGRERRSEMALDVGVLAEHLPLADASLGASSFLLLPGSGGEQGASANLAGDLRLYGVPRRDVRAGYAWSGTRQSRRREDFIFAGGRYEAVGVRVGFVRVEAHGSSEWRARAGFLLRYGRYEAGIAGEQNGAGLDPVYQFTLSATLHE